MKKEKKYTDEHKERALSLYAICGSFSQVAKELGIPTSTIRDWIKRDIPEDEVAMIRLKAKMDFAERAGNMLDKSLDLLDRRLNTALEHEDELEELLHEVMAAPKTEISDTRKKLLLRKITQLQVQSIGDLIKAVGTLYDKRALAKGEATENTSITVEMDSQLEEWAK